MCELHQAILQKTAKVGVIGLGYVGLPVAMMYARGGLRTLGFDTDLARIERLRVGDSYIGRVPPECIQDVIAAGTFEPTEDMSRLGEADALLICVPTPLTAAGDPDLSHIESTVRQIAATLRPGQLIVLESTTYPGTTRDLVLPILNSTGLRLGEGFFSPLHRSAKIRAIARLPVGISPGSWGASSLGVGNSRAYSMSASSSR